MKRKIETIVGHYDDVLIDLRLSLQRELERLERVPKLPKPVLIQKRLQIQSIDRMLNMNSHLIITVNDSARPDLKEAVKRTRLTDLKP